MEPIREHIRDISDIELVSKLKLLVSEERKVTLEILQMLREIEVRRVYSLRAYPSLHEFCTKELGYSSGAAYRRIESMRLIKDIPDVETKILNGELNITMLSKVQGYVKHEKKQGKIVSADDKKQLLSELAGKSSREVQKVLIKLAPKLSPSSRETQKQLNENDTLIRFTADSELMALLDHIKTIDSKSHEQLNDTFKRLAKFYLSKKTKSPAARKARAITSNGRYIPKQVVAEVKKIANNQCQFTDPATQRRCDAKSALEIDHILPYAMGGTNDLVNLRLFCKSHNLFHAIRDYGPEKMGQFIQT
jgi:hypothetical protein